MDGHPKSRLPCNAVIRWILTLCTVFFFVLAAGCVAPAPGSPSPSPTPSLPLQNHTVTKIDLVFFHPVPGCDSCGRVGLYANETVTTYFGPELASGKLVFRDINLNLPENVGLANRYGAYTESLWTGTYDERGFHATEIVDIWYYAYDREGFRQYLKGVLERKLSGTD